MTRKGKFSSSFISALIPKAALIGLPSSEKWVMERPATSTSYDPSTVHSLKMGLPTPMSATEDDKATLSEDDCELRTISTVTLVSSGERQDMNSSNVSPSQSPFPISPDRISPTGHSFTTSGLNATPSPIQFSTPQQASSQPRPKPSKRLKKQKSAFFSSDTVASEADSKQKTTEELKKRDKHIEALELEIKRLRREISSRPALKASEEIETLIQSAKVVIDECEYLRRNQMSISTASESMVPAIHEIREQFNRNQELQGRVGELEKENETLIARMSDLHTALQTIKTNEDEWKSRSHDLENKVSKMQTTVDQLRNDNRQLEALKNRSISYTEHERLLTDERIKRENEMSSVDERLRDAYDKLKIAEKTGGEQQEKIEELNAQTTTTEGQYREALKEKMRAEQEVHRLRAKVHLLKSEGVTAGQYLEALIDVAQSRTNERDNLVNMVEKQETWNLKLLSRLEKKKNKVIGHLQKETELGSIQP